MKKDESVPGAPGSIRSPSAARQANAPEPKSAPLKRTRSPGQQLLHTPDSRDRDLGGEGRGKFAEVNRHYREGIGSWGNPGRYHDASGWDNFGGGFQFSSQFPNPHPPPFHGPPGYPYPPHPYTYMLPTYYVSSSKLDDAKNTGVADFGELYLKFIWFLLICLQLTYPGPFHLNKFFFFFLYLLEEPKKFRKIRRLDSIAALPAILDLSPNPITVDPAPIKPTFHSSLLSKTYLKYFTYYICVLLCFIRQAKDNGKEGEGITALYILEACS